MITYSFVGAHNIITGTLVQTNDNKSHGLT